MFTRPKTLRVLPCIDSNVRAHPIAALRTAAGVDVVSIAPVSTLVYRIQSDDPDALVVVTQDLGAAAWQNNDDLADVLSSTPTILLASQIHASLRKRAAAFHIRSILPLDVTSDQLLAAIQATILGLTVTLEPSWNREDDHVARDEAGRIRTPEVAAEHLTARETLVLRLMALGLGNKEIASRLDISEHTVKFHVSSILAKLAAESRTAAVTIGMMRGLVAI